LKACARNVRNIDILDAMFYQTRQHKGRKRKKLIGVVRKAVLIIGTICFISMAAGATLQLHLLTCEHPDKHNRDTCPICANLLFHSNKFLQYPQIQIIYFDYFESESSHPAYSSLQASFLEAFNPRPPPFAP
jgi:hypothetical protein